MTGHFNPDWNPHYNFSDPKNLAEIEKQDAFDRAGPLTMTQYQSGGGDTIQSPWGSNKALDAGNYPDGYVYKVNADEVVNPDSLSLLQPRPREFCSKELVVRPGNMLSLQRHRGRQEYWAVKEGVLNVILNGERIDVPAGKAIFVPQRAVHCMNNVSDHSVTVIELQTGICREEDNVRLIDFAGRPTYPLTTENEWRSAQAYALLQQEIVEKFGLKNSPHPALLR